ncbi:MAG TPA: LysE family translocator [Actinophytocola sp.]|uniref:LysE family translocator n=1 Tax=Actinophytocola sp. TaxID=1872138 RepID=UPI002DDCD749|nr:LysE family translocator [Actinophytocola sp.]HEV2782039.1 LysE family translocator [Actinophytocola sp.]
MFSASTLAAFLAAGLVIVLLPGSGQALVLARSLAGGFRAGLAATCGLNTGTVLHAVAAGFGLSAVLATSATAFTVIKLVGAGYLVLLGVLTWRAGVRTAPAGGARQGGYLSAVLIGVLNPKVALFFLAFLPQFVDPGRGAVLAQFLVLGLILAALSVAWDCVLSLAAHAVSLGLTASQRVARWRARITGGLFVGLGVRLAFAEQR